MCIRDRIKQGEIIETGKVADLKEKYNAKNLEEVFFGANI